MEFNDIVKFILALFGFGAVTYMATGAWIIPQTSVYAELMPLPAWTHVNQTTPCLWEVHPNTTKTINSVSYGTAGNWTSCSQNSTDWLLWTCSNVTAVVGNVTCPGIRVVQNEFPGTTENLFTRNYTFPSNMPTAIPGCVGMETCTVSGSLAAGTYVHRNIVIDNTFTMLGNVTLTATEAFNITSAGALVVLNTNRTPFTLNINALTFSNAGAISGTGLNGAGSTTNPCPTNESAGNGSTVNIQTASFINTGSIGLNGGIGGGGSYGCCSGGYVKCDYRYACVGGNGGVLNVRLSRPIFNSTGTITTNGGKGGASFGGYICVGGPGYVADANGGPGGLINITSMNWSSTGIINNNGGDRGGGVYPAAAGGVGGANVLSVANNISVTAAITASGGSPGGAAGTNTVSYCANGTGMNWTNFNPTATTSAETCLSAPIGTFIVPNSTSNYIAYLQNVSINIGNNTSVLAYTVQYSKDNGSTWKDITPSIYTPVPSRFNNTVTLDSYRNGQDTAGYAKMRAIAFNNTSKVFSDWIYSSSFNLTDMSTSLTGYAVPNGSISSNTIRFTCNYTNTSTAVEAATPYLYLDGIAYPMTFNYTTLTYYWDNNQTLLAGSHWWQCFADKANYKSALSTNTSFNITGFGIFYPTGQTTVKLTCPFPTISGMTPAGQKAGIGIFRIVNYNATALHNYSLFLNNTLPSGITVYGRCDRFSPNLANWTVLSATTGYKGLININSTNASAYCWLRMDCVSATAGTYTPFDYIFTEE